MEGTWVDARSGCPGEALDKFSNHVGGQMLRVNALLMGNAILMGAMVGIGAYGHRYRHHPLTRFLFLGATILFLPIVSYIVSITGNQYTVAVQSSGSFTVVGVCNPSIHTGLVLVRTAFVQIVGINTTAIVATDAREGRSIAPPAVLLVQAIWTTYLGYNIMQGPEPSPLHLQLVLQLPILIIFAPFALIFAKILFKYYAWYNARQSFALGRNPRLIAGYMEQLPDRSQHAEVASEQHMPPPLLVVTGEDAMLVEKQPHGYNFNPMRSRGNGLVTIDKVWELDNMLLKSTTQLKDVCFSFALFKLLRCRFAKYIVTEAGFMKAQNFLWNVLLKDSDGKRILGVVARELSFLHDYYYSSLPISYSKSWLPILSIFISLLSIGYCLFGTIMLMTYLSIWNDNDGGQTSCEVRCKLDRHGQSAKISFGSLLFDLLPLLSLDALVVLAEVRDIISYLCSDWTKVALICHHASWREYPTTLRRWIGLLLQCRCKLVKPWQDKMNQCSILVLHPRRRTPVALVRRLIPLPEQKKNVKVPRQVEAAIVNTLRSSRGDLQLRNGMMSLQLGIRVGDNLLRACSAKGTCDAMLAWHIATSIFEARRPHSSPASDHKIVATHLSRYCAYLAAYSPELLPDDDAWSNSLYKATKKDAERALAGRAAMPTPELECRQLVELLSSARSKHDVLRDGAKLGEQLVELMEGEQAAWEVLAGFWSEMIIYIAPSDNLDGHAEAIARGGELITLLWALLTHVGVVSRPEATTVTTSDLV